MKILATVRDRSTIKVDVSAPDVAALRAAALAVLPEGHELAQLLNGGRVDGDLVGAAVFRPSATESVTAEGVDYRSARNALDALVPLGKQILSVRVTSDLEG